MPIEYSPLFIITTNNVISGYSGSFKRRQYNVDIHHHFNYRYRPVDEFGHTFFTDWDEEEWLKFDTFMLLCVKFYLANSIAHYPEEVNMKKDAIRATNQTFYEWFEDVKQDFQILISTNDALARYQEETGDKISPKKFMS